MTKTIEIALPDDLYEWATREVTEGRADSVPGVIALGLELLQGHIALAELIEDLKIGASPHSKKDERWIEEAQQAAMRSHQSYLEQRKSV